MTSARLSCPHPCAGSYCPYTRTEPECIGCSSRPQLDAYFERCKAAKERPVLDPYDRALNAWQRLQKL